MRAAALVQEQFAGMATEGAGAPAPAAVDDADDAALNELRAWRDGLSVAEADPPSRAFLTDATLRRYLVARRGDVAGAQAALTKTLAWRREHVPAPGAEHLSCDLCARVPSAHCFVPCGVDALDGSAVIYGCPPRAADTGVEATVAHVIRTLERCFAVADGQRWTWLVDFNAFGLKHAMQARLAVSFATTFSDHQPERLRALLLVNPPSVFSLMLAAARPFADERTLSKIAVLRGSPADVCAALRSRYHVSDGEVLEWIAAALASARHPATLAALPRAARRLVLPGLLAV